MDYTGETEYPETPENQNDQKSLYKKKWVLLLKKSFDTVDYYLTNVIMNSYPRTPPPFYPLIHDWEAEGEGGAQIIGGE